MKFETRISVVRARTLVAATIISLGAAFAPAHAEININIDIAPPAPRYEVVPQVPTGYIWAPGYWSWSNNHYVWVSGHRIVARTGYRWVPDHWEKGNRYREGYWEREEDEHHGKGHKEWHCPPGQAKKGNC